MLYSSARVSSRHSCPADVTEKKSKHEAPYIIQIQPLFKQGTLPGKKLCITFLSGELPKNSAVFEDRLNARTERTGKKFLAGLDSNRLTRYHLS